MLSSALLLVNSFVYTYFARSLYLRTLNITSALHHLPAHNPHLLVTQYLLRVPALNVNVVFLESLEVLLAEVFVCRYVRVHILRDGMRGVERGRRIYLCRRLPYRDQLR